MSNPSLTRRPLASRNTRWAGSIAAFLARSGIRPNTISVLSIFSAAFGGGMLLLTVHQPPSVRAIFFLLAIVGIQGRLLCNLFDGMVAVEGGLKTPTGELYNELPDRISDAILFVCAGYSVVGCTWAIPLGWATAVLACITAYVRALGASMGAGQQFCGPMAKPHRMALLTIACLLSIPESYFRSQQMVMQLALGLMIVGMIITVLRRLNRIGKGLTSK